MRVFGTLIAFGVAGSALISAQTASSSAAYPDPSAAIPSNASAGCVTYLTTLNADADLEACTDPLAQVVNNYTSATKQKGSTAATDATALTTALDKLCKGNLGCQTATIKGKVFDFGKSCIDDLVAQNDAVVSLYDRLYLIVPFQAALCSTDNSGQYCVTTLASSGKVTDTPARRELAERDPMRVIHEEVASFAKRHQMNQHTPEHGMQHSKRQEIPVASNDTTTGIKASNLPFLFIQPTSPQDVLCGQCAQKIMAAYINFETSSPYAIGLQNSDVLSTQSDLYKAGKAQCGAGWSTTVNQLANTTQFAEVSAAKAFALPNLAASVVALAVGGVALLL